ncbi:lipopolysaccharide transport periplasmic protein LptA [Limnohabitans planktonicus II-D5]|uniref:Lipopolysaccharide export system protein LptA n=2 Tax=Limnohabitans planktonicus TaxID=540060 RepID=A0A2T7UG76_9BURK|nr:lipopolysaccharide transport periplasmic protein LptA [Limnohabitans planktonicus II-D5]
MPLAGFFWGPRPSEGWNPDPCAYNQKLSSARFMPSKSTLHPMGLLALSLGLLCASAWAEKADRDKPMHIEADTMRHDETKQLTQFNGGVVAVKGTLVLRAARMEVQQDTQGKQVAKLWAAPNERVFFRQKREGLDEFTEGEAEMAIYDNQADVVTLIQRAEVRLLRGTQLADQIHGEKIVFNNTTEVMTVDGQKQLRPSTGQAAGQTPDRNERVRAVLTPRQSASTPQAAPAAPTLRTSPNLGESKKP